MGIPRSDPGYVAGMGPNIGMCFDRSLPPGFVVEVAERLERDGVGQLWVIEDCFYTAGISLAATALARTDYLQVGLGILPAVARNAAITAMEIATLAEIAPGRVIAGIGHGVQEWMEQMGARTPSPLTTLDETISAVKRLLAGDEVTFSGREVHLDHVRLDRPPATVPPILAGVRGPKSMALAGRVADGVVLAEGAGPSYVSRAIDQAGRPDGFHTSVFTALCVTEERQEAYHAMAPFVAGLLASPNPALEVHPHIEEMRERLATRGEPALVDMPADWWVELGAIGTLDDAVAHVGALHGAGARDVSLFPAAEVDLVREQMDDVARIAAAVG